MPGLLSNDPEALGNYGMAIGLLQGGAPQSTPSYFGTALGKGLSVGTQLMLEGARSNAVTALTEAETKSRLLQAEGQQLGLDQSRRSLAALEAYANTLPPGQREQFMAAPQAFLGAIAKMYEPYSLPPGEVRQVAGQNVGYNPPLPVQTDVPVPGRPGSSTKQWLVPGQTQGQPIGGPQAIKSPEELDPAVQQAKINIANAGRTIISPQISVDLGKGLASRVSDILGQTQAGAQSAILTIRNNNSIQEALDSGKLISGPGASARIRWAQIGETLGVGGRSNEEQLQNTYKVVQGMAENVLAAIQARQGRGQGGRRVGPTEIAILEKARGGKIDEITPSELRVMIKLSNEQAKLDYSAHQQQIKNVENYTDPTTGKQEIKNLSPFFKVPDLPDVMEPRSEEPGTSPSLPPGVTVRRTK